MMINIPSAFFINTGINRHYVSPDAVHWKMRNVIYCNISVTYEWLQINCDKTAGKSRWKVILQNILPVILENVNHQKQRKTEKIFR